MINEIERFFASLSDSYHKNPLSCDHLVKTELLTIVIRNDPHTMPNRGSELHIHPTSKQDESSMSYLAPRSLAIVMITLLVSLPTSGSANQSSFLNIHNSYRAQHCTAPLSWSSRLAARAKAWANQLASECRFALRHSIKGGGENAWAGEGRRFSVNEMVGSWYAEHRNYNYASGRSNGRGIIGHFTQMMWSGSKRLGCGIARCGNKSYAVCQYGPPGNFIGSYTANVKRRC